MELSYDDAQTIDKEVSMLRVKTNRYKMVIFKKEIRIFDNKEEFDPIRFRSLDEMVDKLLRKRLI